MYSVVGAAAVEDAMDVVSVELLLSDVVLLLKCLPKTICLPQTCVHQKCRKHCCYT